MLGLAALSRAATASRASALMPLPVRCKAPCKVRLALSCVTPNTVLNKLPVVYGVVQLLELGEACQYAGDSPSHTGPTAVQVLEVLVELAPRVFSVARMLVVAVTMVESA